MEYFLFLKMVSLAGWPKVSDFWGAWPTDYQIGQHIFSVTEIFGNRLTPLVSNKWRRDSVASVMRELKWLSAKRLIDYHTVCAVQRAIVSSQPERLSSTIGRQASNRHQHDTRRANLLTLPSIRTEAGRRRLCYRGVARLNQLKVDPMVSNFRANAMKVLRAMPEQDA